MLIGYHFAKTGGTAVLAHLTEHLGEAVFPYGPFSNHRRVKRGQPLLEELPDAALKALKVVIGHGVDAERVHYFVFGPDDGSVTGADTGQGGLG